MKEASNNPSMNQFEAMQADWRSVDRQVVEQNLAEKFNDACSELSSSMNAGQANSEDVLSKTKQLGLIVSAQYDFMTSSITNNDDIKMMSWTGLARNKIEEFVAEDPENRQSLLRSAFFDPDLQNVRKLRKIINASIFPAGVYDPESFSAGVALGEISLLDRPYDSERDSQE